MVISLNQNENTMNLTQHIKIYIYAKNIADKILIMK